MADKLIPDDPDACLDERYDPPQLVLTSQFPGVRQRQLSEYIDRELERKKQAGEEGGVRLSVFSGLTKGVPAPGKRTPWSPE